MLRTWSNHLAPPLAQQRHPMCFPLLTADKDRTHSLAPCLFVDADGETLVYSCEYETLDKSIWKNMVRMCRCALC
jgi:hypothetical protein